ncbi:tetratricopeptide repeat protein [Patescibacteria group bacterium]|nr:tetratricopeptide repeat protein [Patescibacteria group bacterium]
MKKYFKNTYIRAVVCIALVLILLFLLRAPIALGTVRVGDQFFGGRLPYSLGIADIFYQTAISIDPNVPDAWHQRARISFLQGDFETALARINTQLELHGDSLMASYYIRGLIYGYDKKYLPAEKDFTHFLEWSPTNWAAANDLAWIYFAEGKFKEAADRTAKTLLTSPDNPWVLTSHAMSVYNLGDSKTALQDLLHAKEEVEKLTRAQWSRAYPGNDPAVASEGLAEFKKTIEKNIELVHSKEVTE